MCLMETCKYESERERENERDEPFDFQVCSQYVDTAIIIMKLYYLMSSFIAFQVRHCMNING